MMKNCWNLPGLILLAATTVPATAHHGAAGLFDENRTVDVTGVVKEWSFVNPHPILILEVADQSGQLAEWDVYFGPSAVSALQRRGYSNATFAEGETVTVTGHPATAAGARGIDVFGSAGRVVRADGRAVP